ncbi:MAG: type II toxin-antitoxin system VapC family toxin [Promethearchaeota archaeon]
MEIEKYIVLDTDYLSYFLMERKTAIETMESLIRNDFLPATTAITKAEMYYGANKKNWGSKKFRKLIDLFNSLLIYDFTSKSSEIYGKIRAKLMNSGLDIGFADTAIASITIEQKATLLTNNVEHFNRVENLDLIAYKL